MMADSDKLYTEMDVGDDLSSTIGTEAFVDRDLVPLRFDNTPRARTEGLQIETFDTLAISVMSSECESLQQCKKPLIPERDALADDIIECLKAWWA
jgi:hypothetical protein